MITVEGVNHQIGSVRILHDIRTRLPEGRLTALIGPNGAGKSTLMRLIGRLEALQSGRITVAGHDLATTRTGELAKIMAILGQNTAIASRLRVAELVGFGRWPHHKGRPRPQDRDKVSQALEAFALTSLANRFLDEISGGQAQRAHIAMSFAQDTPWLLLDEPLNNLDMAHARGLMTLLSELVRGQGRSVAMVVHEINYAAAWADHVIAMKDGRIMAEGDPDTVLTEAVLSKLYDTPVSVGRHRNRPLVLHHA
ncbi:ABC transporter ATP-binding protein [Paracoccus alkanivorans]|uniref:ATP-binding cassette domain-containing protein n=1 Tax=Paracoccus alkanivorans TaxID=2116655 RepID=A0A3M0MDI0_9RHOB|nr:ATP-binding cassette domain-containing protein [Paracoccus alkanivorans]RMC35746.1 ATP-binding cassette domain-containing protein [Paracoccus alkanivorans]